MVKPIAITLGCPAGIGPDIVLQLARDHLLQDVVIIGDEQLLQARAKQCRITVDWSKLSNVRILHVPLNAPCIAGQGSPVHSSAVLACLEEAVSGCLNQRYHAMVTCPVNKALINDAGIPFTGHTEWIAEKTKTDFVVMMLANPTLRVALVTTHLALKDVPLAITENQLKKTILVLNTALQQRFAIKQPRILVLGLNPHAGENGYLGREEIDIINPVLQQFRQVGLQLTGPVAADTAFQADNLSQYDCVLAMYHDQGLTPLKTLGFGDTVNITLGLPIIRTSVDHGTAYAIAGTGLANPSSLLAAIKMARSQNL